MKRTEKIYYLTYVNEKNQIFEKGYVGYRKNSENEPGHLTPHAFRLSGQT